MRSFVLPNSRLTLFHSTRLFTVVPGDPAALEPDMHAILTVTDYFRRQDPVLAAITNAVGLAAISTGRRRAASTGPVCPQ